MLNREELNELVVKKGLVSGYMDLETQLTPNGFDLTLNQVSQFEGQGSLDFSNKERVLPPTSEVPAVKDKPDDRLGWWTLGRGVYKVTTNEVVSIPNDLIAVAYPRSSLLRMGCFTQTAVWDAGYKGRSEFLLIVENPGGIRLKQNARIAQLAFWKIKETKKGYQGIYQNKV